MMKKITILILVFISTFSIVFASFYEKAEIENHRKIYFYYEVSFDAKIDSENLYGELRNSDGTTGKEVQIPNQTEVHVVAIKTSGDIRVETPFTIEIDGESCEIIIGYFSMENIDKSTYAKELLRSIVQELEQNIDLKIRKHLINSIVVAVVLFVVFSLIFLLVEKKCDSDQKYRRLFGFLLFATILSLLFLFIWIQYTNGMR